MGSFRVGLSRRSVVSLSRFAALDHMLLFWLLLSWRCLQWTLPSFFSLRLLSYVLYISFFWFLFPFICKLFFPLVSAGSFSSCLLFFSFLLAIFCVGSFLLFVQLLRY
uniref:Transmembrane protein n=1 Tax=Salix viminalis TaxID=40686 RepID=A0A6N2M6F1_SALVM